MFKLVSAFALLASELVDTAWREHRIGSEYTRSYSIQMPCIVTKTLNTLESGCLEGDKATCRNTDSSDTSGWRILASLELLPRLACCPERHGKQLCGNHRKNVVSVKAIASKHTFLYLLTRRILLIGSIRALGSIRQNATRLVDAVHAAAPGSAALQTALKPI